MKIYVDIDETICFYENEREYRLAIPHKNNISKINKLYDDGHEITYYTARGTIDKDKLPYYRDITIKQLEQWEAKHHKLILGHKPAYDLLICDKTKRIEEI